MPTSAPHPDGAADQGAADVASQLAQVRLFLVGILVIAVPTITANQPQRTLLPLMLASLLPWVIALGMLGPRRLWHAGFAVAVTASSLALVPLASIIVLVTLLSGPLVGEPQYFGLLALTGLCFATCVQGIRGVRLIPESARWKWAWAAGLVGTTAYASMLIGAAQFVVARQTEQTRAPEMNGKQAQRNIATLARCAAAYAAQSPAKSFPRSLKELAIGAPPCLDPAIASGESEGFRYGYYPAIPGADGIIRVYDACAEPIHYNVTGQYAYAIDENGTSSRPSSTSADREAGTACRYAWDDEYKALRLCAARYAAQHPDRGYPASLSDIDPAEDGCLMAPRATGYSRQRGDSSWFSGTVRYTYIAGEPDASGRITTYEVQASPAQ